MAFSMHKCIEGQCSGSKFADMKFQCKQCQKYTFIECVASTKEISNFLKLTNFKSIADDDKIEEYTELSKKKLNYVFHDLSLIQFICSECQINGLSAQSREEFENKIAELERQIESLKNTSCNGTHSRNTNNENNNEIGVLKSIIEDKNNSFQVLSTEIKTAYAMQLSNIDRIKTDFESAFLTSIDIVNALDSASGGGTLPHDEANPWVNNRRGGSKNNKVRSDNRNVKASPFEDPTAKNREPKPNLRQKNNDTNANRGPFEIYVSKFKTSVKPDEITKFILESSDINDPELFSVQLLGGFWDRQTFSSFKITTLKYDVCRAILSINWNPQSARIFEQKPPDRKNINPFNRNRFNRQSNTRKSPHYQRYNQRYDERIEFQRQNNFQGQQHYQRNNMRPTESRTFENRRPDSRKYDRERDVHDRPEKFDRYRRNDDRNPNFNARDQHPDSRDFLYMKDHRGRQFYPHQMDRNNYRYK